MSSTAPDSEGARVPPAVFCKGTFWVVLDSVLTNWGKEKFVLNNSVFVRLKRDDNDVLFSVAGQR